MDLQRFRGVLLFDEAGAKSGLVEAQWRRRMWTKAIVLLRLLLPAFAGIALFATAGYGQWVPPRPVPPIPAGEARVWFYRDAGVYDSQEQPYILMNGTIVGVSQPVGSFYFDVRPGFYHVTVQQYLDAPEEAANIDLTPGQQAYLKIVSLTDCISGSSNRRGSDYQRPCFYVWNMPAQVGQAALARTPFYGGR
jgi:hypothetical protein